MDGASHLDMAYKLVEYGGKGRLKTSKVLYPGWKQVFRQVDNGRIVGDVIGRFDENLPGELLLQRVMKEGRTIARIDLEESRRRFERELGRLPGHLRKLKPTPDPYPVAFSDRLQRDLEAIRSELAAARELQ